VLVQVGDDAAVLARGKLIEAVDRQDEVAFGDLQPRSNVPVFSILWTFRSTTPPTGFTVAAALSM